MSYFLYWHLKAWMIPISTDCKWLVQFGGENVTLIFFNALVSLECVAHEQQDFSVFCRYLAMQLHKKLLEVPEVIHELEFSVYLVGSFFTFLKHWDVLYLPVTSGGNFSVPSAFQPSRIATLCSDFVPLWQESPL
jgi:hypothetical protein